MVTVPIYPASGWLERLERVDRDSRLVLEGVYGPNPGVLDARMRLLRAVVQKHIQRFGDEPVRVFRSPGRINLRGMHVDTHGGYLNLMTHQREAVVTVTPLEDDEVTFANLDAQFPEVSFRIREPSAHPAFSGDWLDFIRHPDIQGPVTAQRGHWGNYLKGCALSAQHRFPGAPLRGVRGVVGSDVPRGAALSSSAALSLGVLLALLGRNRHTLSREELILAMRDAEWYAGSRIGVSDQGAMILGGLNELVNVALLAKQLDASSARRLAFPDELRVLVINSYTERSLSGAQLVDYARNRFAYSLALEIVRQELRAAGMPEEFALRMDRLAHLTPAALAQYGGAQAIYRLLRGIPETIGLRDLQAHYCLPNLDQAYQDYFGTVPEADRPREILLRGPLMFGIAESERARVFFEAMKDGDYTHAGQMMSIGHDGDRLVCADGRPYHYDVSDGALDRMAAAETPIEQCPGVYGASSPVLDALVDTALEAGALGACLTGAGIAGAVLALCRKDDCERVAEAVCAQMSAPGYPALAKRREPLSRTEIADAVVENHATSAAGELGMAACSTSVMTPILLMAPLTADKQD